MSARDDAVVVLGAGTNELVAAHMLSRAGRRVTVLEEHASPEWETGWIPPSILRALGLDGKVRIHLPDPWLVAMLPGGGQMELYRDMRKTVASIRRLSESDARKWPRFCARMTRLAGFMERQSLKPPGRPLELGFALRVRRLGREGMQDLMRVLPMPVAELLDEWFECDALKGALGALGIARLQQGPRSAGTAFRLLHQLVGSAPGVFRPPRSDLRRVLRELPGPQVRSLGADKIVVREGRVAGIVLSNGEELPATVVLSGASPQRTLLELGDPGWLDPELVRAVRNLRARGVVARATLRLDRPSAAPPFVMAPSLDYLERAYDHAKYGRVSRETCMEVHTDGETAEVAVQYAPFRLAGGEWTDALRRDIGEAAKGFVARVAPGTVVREAKVLAPPDLETQFGWPEGQADHVELTLDQALWARPLAELARYRTPVNGLWLCGPAMHPGRAIAGASGYHCVREILRG